MALRSPMICCGFVNLASFKPDTPVCG